MLCFEGVWAVCDLLAMVGEAKPCTFYSVPCQRRKLKQVSWRSWNAGSVCKNSDSKITYFGSLSSYCFSWQPISDNNCLCAWWFINFCLISWSTVDVTSAHRPFLYPCAAMNKSCSASHLSTNHYQNCELCESLLLLKVQRYLLNLS